LEGVSLICAKEVTVPGFHDLILISRCWFPRRQSGYDHRCVLTWFDR